MRGQMGLAAVTVLAAATTQAAVLISSNFNSADVGTVANGTFGEFTANAVTNTAVSVVQVSTGDRAVVLTDNITSSTTGTSPYLRRNVTGLSTSAAGDNHVTGSFTFRRLPLSTGTEGSFRLLINREGGTVNATATDTLVLLRVAGNQISYGNGSVSGTTIPTSTIALASDTTYVFELDLDLSSTSQDTWSFKVKSEGGTELYASPTLNTALANGTPGHFMFTGGIAAAASSPDPFVRLDNISFSAAPIPEPATVAMVGMVAVLGMRRSRRLA